MSTPWGQTGALHKHSLLLLLSQAVGEWLGCQEGRCSFTSSLLHRHIHTSPPSPFTKNWAQNQS